MGPVYRFATKLWMYSGEGAWYFLTIPHDQSDEIKSITSPERKGFGSIKVVAQIGNQSWHTSIFPDAKSGCYLLPVKKDIRQAEHLADGTMVEAQIQLQQV